MTKKVAEKNDGDLSGDVPAGQGISQNLLREVPKNIPGNVVNIIPKEVAEKYGMMAFEKSEGILKIAMLYPENVEALNALNFVAEKEKARIETYAVSPDIFSGLFVLYNETNEALKEAVDSFEDEKYRMDVDDSGKSDKKKEKEILKDAPVTKLVEVVISHAVEGKASDIHIEPMDKDYRVRFRVDGVLHVSLIFPLEIGPVVISRIKILANLKIDEKRKPQDGRFRLNFNKKDIDFRVSSLPVVGGEKIVMRILDKDGGTGSIDALGLVGRARTDIEKAIQETYGMILMTGPTGSGKSTTLYTLLKILNNEERNIITLEDPVEYFIEGMNQSQVKPEIGYTFASGLRTVLRQDPNVIMVGEIRDGETAELAVHAALTGHLMFSTLHTNTAIGAIPRLIDMGIEPFLLSSSLRMVIAQRLVRRICEKCKKEKEISAVVGSRIIDKIKNISAKQVEDYGINLTDGVKFYHGEGCDACNGTGLKGRVAIYEAVPVTEAIKNIIIEKRGSEELIKKERDRMGVLTIEQDGVLKILKGLTTIEEVERVTECNFTTLEEAND
ncbi:MAG: GspE/PulE family protein [Parcubacteria group bacterium]|jgi:type IV pilus assembly protein PilB